MNISNRIMNALVAILLHGCLSLLAVMAFFVLIHIAEAIG